MAKRHAIFPLFLAIAFSGLLLLCGCEMESSSTADALPPPSFDPPRMMAAAPQAPLAAAPVRPIPAPRTAQPAAPRVATAGIPADWIPPVAPRSWREIIVHHSATTTGGAAAFDKEHKAKGWDGLGYDFVIGNGTDTGDGQIEVGWRWTQQKIGAHDKTPDNYYNEYGIGICLVGNFMVERPTPRQLQSLTRLSSYLMKTYHIPPDHMLGHGNTKPTECPGKYLDVAAVRQQAGLLAGYRPVASLSSSNELLANLPR